MTNCKSRPYATNMPRFIRVLTGTLHKRYNFNKQVWLSCVF